MFSVLCNHVVFIDATSYLAILVLNYGISNAVVLEIPEFMIYLVS